MEAGDSLTIEIKVREGLDCLERCFIASIFTKKGVNCSAKCDTVLLANPKRWWVGETHHNSLIWLLVF